MQVVDDGTEENYTVTPFIYEDNSDDDGEDDGGSDVSMEVDDGDQDGNEPAIYSDDGEIISD